MLAASTRRSARSAWRQFAAVAIALASSASLATAQWSSMVVFGDSLSDTGSSLHYTSNIPLVTTRPTGPSYATGRWTNGSNINYPGMQLATSQYNTIWHWELADRLGIARAQNVNTGTPNRNNYAAGAATTGAGRQSILGFTTSDNIGYQVNTMFLGANPTMSSSTLYTIMGGGNDIRDAVRGGTANSQATSAAAGRAAASNITTYITTLATRAQQQNVRISVAWPNAVPMQLIPDFADAYGGSAAWRTNADIASAAFRDQWASDIATLRTTFANNLDIYGVDLWSLFTGLNNGTIPGFETFNRADPILDFNNFSGIGFSPSRNTTARVPAGANPDTYLFWDRVHPTARIQAYMGEYMSTIVPLPGVVVTFAVSGLFASRRRRAPKQD